MTDFKSSKEKRREAYLQELKSKEAEAIKTFYRDSEHFKVEGKVLETIPVEDIRQMYIADECLTLETIKDKYKISLEHLQYVYEAQDWHKLRSEVHSLTRQNTQKILTDQLKDLLDVNLKIQQLKNVQLLQQVKHLQNHLTVYGDLWLRDPDRPGQILKDMNGLPKKIPIPEEVRGMQEMVKLLQGVNSLINERESEASKELSSVEVLNFGGVFEATEND